MAKKKQVRFWKSLPKEDKKGVVQALLERGYTCAAIGKALGTTKNAVVGYQHSHLPALTGRSPGSLEEVPEDVLRPLLTSVWPVEITEHVRASPAEPEEGGRVSTKLTSDWRRQCQYTGRCGYERLPDSTSCGRPGHDN